MAEVLPIELLRHVICIIDWDCRHMVSKNHGYLRDFCLVSRTWASIAQEILFSTVQLYSESQCNGFGTVVCKWPRLGAMVKALELIVDPSKGDSDIRSLAIALPNLRSLYLPGSLQPLTIRQLQEKSTIDTLRIRCRAPQAVDSIKNWPSLKFFEVTVSGRGEFLRPSAPPPFNLYELRWRVNLLDHREYREIDWILSNSSESLNILELSTPIPDETFAELSLTHRNLRSLRLTSLPQNWIEHISNFHKLEEFVITQCPSLDLLLALPLSVEHFGFGASRDFPEAVFENFLDIHSKISTLTIEEATSLNETTFEEIVALCGEKNIKIYAPEQMWTTFDPYSNIGLVTRFPRAMSAFVMNHLVLYQRGQRVQLLK